MDIAKKGGFLKIFYFFIFVLSMQFIFLSSVSAQVGHKGAVIKIETVPGTDVEIGDNMATPPRDIDNIKFEKMFTPPPDCQFVDTTSPPTVGLPFAGDIKSGKFRIIVSIARCLPPEVPAYEVRVKYKIEYVDEVDKGEFTGSLGPGGLTKELKIHTSESNVGWYPLYMDFKIFIGKDLVTHQNMAHRIYITLNKPQAGVNTYPDGPRERWLEVATDWARGADDKVEAIEKMNEKEHTNPFGWLYGYRSNGDPRVEDWEQLINPAAGVTLITDCHYFALVLERLTKVIGIATAQRQAYRPGKNFLTHAIPPAKPALDNRGINARDQDKLPPNDYDRWMFGNHCLVKYRKLLYDPTFGEIRNKPEDLVYAFETGYSSFSNSYTYTKTDGTGTLRVFPDGTRPLNWPAFRYKNPHIDIHLGTGLNVTKIVSDRGIDTDNDGLFNFLNVTFEVNVTERNNYTINTILFFNELLITTGDIISKSPRQILQISNNAVNLLEGTMNVSVYFDSSDINKAGFNGNYSVFVIVSKNATQTFASGFNISSYNATQFQGLTLSMINVTDFGLDTNGNGKFDYLIIKLNLSVSRSTFYNISVSLQSNNKDIDILAENNSNLANGNVTVTFKFDSLPLRQSRTNGPYNLEITLSDDNYIESILYNTSAYSFLQFDDPPAEFTGNFSDYGFDEDADGLLDALIVKVGVNVTISGNYTIIGSLIGPNGADVAFATNTTLLPTENASIFLQFDGMDIFGSKVNGPYNLTLLRIFYSDENLSDLLDDAYTTASYLYTQFVPGGVIQGTIRDSVGNLVPNAIIIASGPNIDAAFSNLLGQYYIDRLKGGSYDISVWPPSGFVLGFNSTTVNITSNETKIINFTLDGIMPDIFPPSITLISPINNGIENTTNSITFIYNVSDVFSNITFCSLFINNTNIQNDTSITEDIPQNFTQFLANGTYNWSISCIDNSINANQGFSETRVLIVNVTPVTIACGSTITQNTNLTQDLTTTGSCLDILSNNIILDCQGHSITGTGGLSNGIMAVNRNNITIQNCVIKDFNFNILLENTTNSIISNNTGITQGDGIRLVNSNSNKLFNNNETSTENRGIALHSSHNNILINNTGKSTTFIGIAVGFTSNNNLFQNNIGMSEGNSGIELHTGAFNTLIENTGMSNRSIGIKLGSNNYSNFTYNKGVSISGVGIQISGIGNRIEHNTALGITRYGLDHTGGSKTILRNNTIHSFKGRAAALSLVSEVIFEDNRITSEEFTALSIGNIFDTNITGNIIKSSFKGIEMGHSQRNLLRDNSIVNNSFGIELVNSTDNLIYNNFFNNTLDAKDDGINFWNITKTSGINIIGGPFFGGNFWHDYQGQDLNGDGLGDTLLPYNSTHNITNGGDFLPLVVFFDDDKDRTSNSADNCPTTFNPDQSNIDSDSQGDVCDSCPNNATNTCDLSESVAANINASGGSIITASGNASVAIPVNALANDTSISIEGSSSISGTSTTAFKVQTSASPLSLIYSFNPAGTIFNQSVTITLRYNDTGINESTIDIYLFNSTSGLWEPQGATCNTILNECSLNVSHFSDFIVGGFEDRDGDGVLDKDDKCLSSVLDNIILNPNQYAQNINFGAFEVGPNNQQSIVYNMLITKGCTCREIVSRLNVGEGHLKKGCSPSLMENWTRVSAQPDRNSGIGRR